MSKSVKIWVAVSVSGKRESRRTLLSLCQVLGIPYSTAKKKQDKEGGVTAYVVGNTAWEIKMEIVE